VRHGRAVEHAWQRLSEPKLEARKARKQQQVGVKREGEGRRGEHDDTIWHNTKLVAEWLEGREE